MLLKKLCLTAVLGLATALAFAPAALAGNKVTVGPAGYNTPGGSTLVVAGTAGTVVGSGDHVVICHAIGGANGDGFVQIAPSAGTLFGHDGHEGDRDIIPPFVYEDNKGNRETSLANGSNWTSANIAIYNNGCAAAPDPPKHPDPPADVCPNIEGVQTSVPAGMVKDASGNCVSQPTTTTTVVLQQTPQTVIQQVPTTVVIERVVVTTKQAPAKVKKAKKAKKIKKAKRKAKRSAVKGVRAGARKPRVLPRTR